MKVQLNKFIEIIFKGFSFMLIVLVLLITSAFTLPKNISKKVNKQIVATFHIEDFNLEKISLPKNLNTKVLGSNNLSKIQSNNSTIGYALIDKAPSRSFEFDYLVLLNPQLEIKSIKVLIYREDHGYEIGSKRWLKQFFGLTSNDRAILQQNIDGISGATISVQNMTTEMDNLLQDLVILEKNNILLSN